MSNKYGVDEVVASQAITEFYDAAADMRSQISAVAAAVDSTGSGWVGQAFRAFSGASENWGSDFSTLVAALDDLTDRAGRALGTLTTAEEDNVTAVTSYTNLAV